MEPKFLKFSAVLSLISSMLMAQTSKIVNPITTTPSGGNTETTIIKDRTCGTVAPDIEWEHALQKLIAERKLQESNGNKLQANYNIPVVIHIIHGGQAIGTYPNISNAQAVSQISILNKDFGGTGLNFGNYPANAFTNYATAAALPAANKDANGRPKISNTNVTFCLAMIDKNGGPMSEIGIDRVNFNSLTLPSGFSSKDPANSAYSSISIFSNYLNNVLKPQTIWDPTKYLNIWVTDQLQTLGLLGIATFPAGVTLDGITSSFGTATTDGVYVFTKAFGNTGTTTPLFDLGRTATHEIGHWVGLRHIWGDGACATDYCLDTPPASASNSQGPYPLKPNSCTTPTGINNTTPNGPNGEMFMNFMDYSIDKDLYMFTEDQRTRIQTTMANGTYRKLLGTHGLCSPSGNPIPAVSLFTIPATGCLNLPVNVVNNSTGTPAPSYTWSSSPSAGVVFTPNANAVTPTITFANIGNYIVTLAAKSGTTAVSTSTMAVTINTCSTNCDDTLSNILKTDIISLSTVGASTNCIGGGYMAGNNCYKAKEFAEFHSAAGLPITAKIVGAIVLFYKENNRGTKGNSSVAFNVYKGDNLTGPSGAPIASAVRNISMITLNSPTNSIPFIGNGSTLIRPAIPYKFSFSPPISITGDFLISVTTPTVAVDTIAILQAKAGSGHPLSSAWELSPNDKWTSFKQSWGQNISLAILPIISCITGINDPNGISSNYSIFPNPSEGMFNFAVALPIARDLQFIVSNSMGQEVYSRNEKAITNSVVSLDLSHLSKGIYVVTIIDSKGDKAIRKLIIQ